MYDEHLIIFCVRFFIHFDSQTHTHTYTNIYRMGQTARTKRRRRSKFGFRMSEKPIRIRTRNRTKPNATETRLIKQLSNPDRLLYIEQHTQIKCKAQIKQ